MHRPRYATGFLLAPIVFTTLLLTVGCGGGGPEKIYIDNFFRAARLRDNVTLGNISMTQFDPRTEGQVESTSVVSVSEETVTPLHLKELGKAVDEAKKADDEFTAKKRAFQDQHTDEVNRVLKGQPAKGKDNGFQREWQKWVDDTKESSKKLSDAREALAVERNVADISMANQQVDPTQYDGAIASKDYTVTANMITPTGQHVTRTLVITLQQARLTGDKPITGKWIITKIKDVTTGGKSS